MNLLQNAIMSTSITVRDVPDETHAELAARAASRGQSLQEYLRSQLVALAQRPDAQTLMARVRARKLSTESSLTTERTLDHRDSDRR
jgi:plasmid stability protein